MLYTAVAGADHATTDITLGGRRAAFEIACSERHSEL